MAFPENITIELKDGHVEANSLILANASPYLFNLFHTECVDKNSSTISLKTENISCFTDLLEYINTGEIKELWKKDQAQSEALMCAAGRLELLDVVGICAQHLQRYFTLSNAIKYLGIGLENRWDSLCTVCFDFFNKQNLGFRFLSLSQNTLSIEFTNYREEGLDLFYQLKSHVSHLKLNGSLVEDPNFSELLHAVPSLVSLDLSATRLFSERMMDIPEKLRELDVSSCGWIQDVTLQRLIVHLPHLQKLSLESNGNVGYSSFSTLFHLKELTSLDVARCHQLQNEDLKLICRSCPFLESLNLEECHKLTDAGFIEIAKQSLPLTHLNVSNTNISNTPLTEICLHCKKLTSLEVVRCPYVTEKGILRLRQLYQTIMVQF